MIIQIFVCQSPKVRCYGNQLNLGDVHKRRVERPLFFASAFDNGLADRKIAFKTFNGNNQSTSWPNVGGELPSNNLEVYAVKTRSFCRHSPAIWRRYSFVTLAFQNGLKVRNFDFSRVIGIISENLVVIWWDSFQWLWSLIHNNLYSRRRKFFWGGFRFVQ